MVRIDYIGGSYGNYLEYIINRYIFNLPSAKEFVPFNSIGASHLKPMKYLAERKVIANHYSFESILKNVVGQNDQVIQILIDENSCYHAYYNLEVRAGDLSIDLISPEKDCLNKLDKLIDIANARTKRKFSGLKEQLITDFGIQQDYKRSHIRNYFYSKLLDTIPKLGNPNAFSNYNGIDCKKTFLNASLIAETDMFINELKNIATWLDLSFTPDSSLYDIHFEFINQNPGLQSYKKCSTIIDNIIQGNDYEFSTNILEEAWINCNITKRFQIIDGIDCFGDYYPTNTRLIYDQITDKLK